MTMMHRSLSIRLIDDCVFSERSATEGSHETLDRIPGSALLGAAAARLYVQVPSEVADLIFHSGRVRFSDGFPLASGNRAAWPVPLCWHFRKDDKPAGPGFDPAQLFNLQHVETIRDSSGAVAQAKQLRDGYITADGRWIKPSRNYRMKTAIDRATGLAADGQLFGYSSLSRGQDFVAFVEADEDVDPAVYEQVCAALCGEIVLGRSRSAEYGRVEIRPLDGDFRPVPGVTADQSLTLWLLTDFAPCDANGQPMNELDIEALGLPGGCQIDWSRSFVRSRSYSVWNAKRLGYERERKVVRAGSVITVTLAAQVDLRATVDRLSKGIGLHVQSGLGRVWVNPPLLARVHPTFSAFDPAAQDLPAPSVPDSPLAHWICQQVDDSGAAVEQCVAGIAKQYLDLTVQARRVLGLPECATDVFPSRSQWGRVLEVARVRRGVELYRALFGNRGAAIDRDGKGWSLEVPVAGGQKWERIADWIKGQIGKDDQCDEELVQRLARRLMDQPNRRRG